jgi:hypothetical protein
LSQGGIENRFGGVGFKSCLGLSIRNLITHFVQARSVDGVIRISAGRRLWHFLVAKATHPERQ